KRQNPEPENINQVVDVFPREPGESESMSRVPDLVHSSLAIPPPARRGSQTEVLIGARRAGALAGLVGVILYTAGVLLPGDAPAPSAATSQVVTYFVDQRGLLLAGFALQLIALAFLLAFGADDIRSKLGPHSRPRSPPGPPSVASTQRFARCVRR